MTYKVFYLDYDNKPKEMFYNNKHGLSKKKIKKFLLDNLDINTVVQMRRFDIPERKEP